MRKIYVMMLTLMVALAANAASQQLYLIGDPVVGGWNPTVGEEMTQTADGVFTIDVTLEGEKYFGFADGFGANGDDWDGLKQHRYGPESQNDATANNGVTKMKYVAGSSWKLGAGEWTLTANTNDMTLTVVKKAVVEVEYAYAIHGDIWEGASEWTPKAMEEVNGKWVLTANCKATGNFGIRAYKKGDETMAQLIWIASAGSADLAVNTPANVVEGGSVNFNWGFEGESTFTFDPETMTITVSNDNYLPEPTYDGTTVFFENTENWAEVAIYLWNDGGVNNGSWPGQKIDTKIPGTNIYYHKLEKNYDKIIFNNNNKGSQTKDLKVVHGHIYTVNDVMNSTGTPYVFDMPETTTISIHGDHADKVTLGETGFTGDVKEAAAFKVVIEESAGHEVFYRLVVNSTAPAKAPSQTYGGFVALPESGEITIPCGEGELRLATRVHGVMSTPRSYAYNVVNDAITGVEDIEVEAAGTAEYFNLQGVRVANPEAGHVYIRVLGGKAAKVRL